ncbi:hypothetical protein MRX96_017248 [Rhipicephalus microplus]
MAQVIFFVAALVSLGSCQQSPVISYISKEMVVGIGDTVDLQCSVQYAEAYPIIWVKINERDPSNNLFISSGSKAIVPDQRFSIRHDEGSNTYTLQITKLQETDSGLYQCQIILGPTSKLSSNVYVHVRVPPIISDNSTRICDSQHRPEHHFGVLCYGIFNVSKNDRGTYYCIADNGVGNGARRNIGVEVEFAPVVSVDRPRYGQALQNPMDLLCHIEAFPSPSIVWLKDGYQLNDNQYYQISIFSTADEFTDSTLRIIAIEKKQYGNYTCKALNKLGSDEKIIELYETVNVICPPACDKSYQSGSSHLQSSFACFLVMISMILAITMNKQ